MPSGGKLPDCQDLPAGGDLRNGALTSSHDEVIARGRVPLDSGRLELRLRDMSGEFNDRDYRTGSFAQLLLVDRPVIYRQLSFQVCTAGTFAHQQQSPPAVIRQAFYFAIPADPGSIDIEKNGLLVGALTALVQPP